MGRLLHLTLMAFDQRRFDRCLQLCEDMEAITPRCPMILELRDDAANAKVMRKDAYFEILSRKVELWGVLVDQEGVALPCPFGCRIIPPVFWETVARMHSLGSLASQIEEMDLSALGRKLTTFLIDLSLENWTLEDSLAYLRDFAGINLVLDAASRERIPPAERVAFHVREMPLGDALSLLLWHHRLAWRVTEENVVLVFDPSASTP